MLPRVFSLACIFFAFLDVAVATPGCIQRSYPYGSDPNMVCVCNSTYCDTIEALGTIASGTAVLYQTALASGKRMDKSTVSISSFANAPVITFDASTAYQQIIGFGGAFTDAAGINIASLPQTAQNLLMQQYFGPSGTEYTIGRVPIASTDFSTRIYSYDDTPGDFALNDFALAQEDFDFKIPYIQQAMQMQANSGGIKLFGSPWSAPGWMKDNGQMQASIIHGGGALISNASYYTSYANYFVKFFEAYHNNSIDFWGVIIENEPSFGLDPTHWQAMFFSAESERDFLKGYLGPAIKGADVSKNVNIMILDDQRSYLPTFADIVLADPVAANYTAGIGIHWYFDPATPASVLTQTYNNHPDKFMLGTEACNGWIPVVDQGVALGNFSRGERYAYDIIEDLNNYVAGWTDWNIALNLQGGPNWKSNFVDSPIIVNASAGEFYKQPMYYALAHFSKFLKPGSQRVSNSNAGNPSLGTLSAVMADGRKYLTVQNPNTQSVPISIADAAHSGKYINVNVPARSINTILWNQ